LFIFVANGKFHKSGVSVEFNCLGFRVLAPGNMDAEQLDSTLCNLYSISHQQETKSLSELQNCFDTFMRYSKYYIVTFINFHYHYELIFFV